MTEKYRLLIAAMITPPPFDVSEVIKSIEKGAVQMIHELIGAFKTHSS